MEIKLMEIEFKNFKGLDKLKINFGDSTSIRGRNASGKTTVIDGFTWLLFGKDSKDRKDFEIKTLDENGEALHGLEHSVKGVLSVDGREIILERIYKEKWVKERGASERELKGHTTEYLINEVPQSMREYQGKINAIFEESKFKLVTNPLFFTNMKWQEQRKLLLEVVGDICESDIFAYNKGLKKLEGAVTEGIDNFNAMNKNKIKKLKEKIKSLPYRIDECNNSIQNLDFDAIEFRKKSILGGIKNVEDQLQNKAKANEEKLKLENDIYNLKSEYQDKINEAKRLKDEPLKDIYKELEDNKKQLKYLDDEILSLKNSGVRLNNIMVADKEYREDKINENNGLRSKIEKIRLRKMIIDNENFICPTCKRDFEVENIEKLKVELAENFENEKKKDILGINKIGISNKEDIEFLAEKIEKAEEDLVKINQKIAVLNDEKIKFENNIKICIDKEKKELSKVENGVIGFEGRAELYNKIKELEAKRFAYSEDMDKELLNRKAKLQMELEQANKELAAKDNNKILKARISELEEEEKKLSSQIIELEGLQFLGEEFVRTKVEMLEDSINKKFNGQVKFKLFKNQINGGLEECCEAMVEGVPFSNVNTAAQINGGLSIVNILSKHFNVKAPIFVDNSESINNIIATDSQIIKLIVSLDEELKVDWGKNN